MSDVIKELQVIEFKDYEHLWLDWCEVCNLLYEIDREIHKAYLLICTYIREGKEQPIYPGHYQNLQTSLIQNAVGEAAFNRIPSEYKMTKDVTAPLVPLKRKFNQIKRRLSNFLKYDKDIRKRGEDVLNFIKNKRHVMLRPSSERFAQLSYDEQYIIQLSLNLEKFVKALLTRVENMRLLAEKIVKELLNKPSSTAAEFNTLLNQQRQKDISQPLRLFALRNLPIKEEIEILDKMIQQTIQRAVSFRDGLPLLYEQIAKLHNIVEKN